MMGLLQWNFIKFDSSPKTIVKMKPNKLLESLLITSIHARRGRDVKFKSARHQLVDDILLNRKFYSHLWKQCIQSHSMRYQDFHKTISSKEKNAMLLHSMTIKHSSKLGKLNGVGKIFLVLFGLPKYTLISTIHFMVDDVESS
jgi:hypothetical protein